VFFQVLATRHTQLLIRNPSQKRNLDLLSLSKPKTYEKSFKKMSLAISRRWGHKPTFTLPNISPKGSQSTSVNRSGSGQSSALLFSGRQ